VVLGSWDASGSARSPTRSSPITRQESKRGEEGGARCPRSWCASFCSEEIDVKKKWLDVPGRMTEVAHLNGWKENIRPEVRSRSV
jgi:hypothetical protein